MTTPATLHRWFKSGDYSLLGHFDLPELRRQTGVVIVPPFGSEEACSYRPIRFVARALAESGYPVLRYDLPGTGNSSDGTSDSGLVDAWIDSVGDAAADLRALSGVRSVAVLGISLGALLAATAAGRGAEIGDLILWGAAASGRAVLREMRAFAKMERWEYSTEAPFPAEPISGFEVGGFVVSPELERALGSLDLAALQAMESRNVYLLSRDDLKPDEKVVTAFRALGCNVRQADGVGFAKMMVSPHEAEPPLDTAQTIVKFLDQETLSQSPASADSALSATIRNRASTAVESAVTIGKAPDLNFGVLTEPAHGVPHSEACALFLNAGGMRHTGPNRMWVEAARRGAARGISSLRFDLQGIGESEGEKRRGRDELYDERLVGQVECAMDFMRARLGCEKFAIVGLCAGAFWAFHAAVRNRDVRAAVLLNPRLFFWDPEVDRRRLLRRGARGLRSPGDWLRLIRGGFQWNDLKHAARIVFGKSSTSRESLLAGCQIPPRMMAAAWAAIRDHQTRVSFVFNEGEPLLLEMEEEGQMPAPGDSHIQVHRLAKAGHTFRPQWAQRYVGSLIDDALASVAESRHSQTVV